MPKYVRLHIARSLSPIVVAALLVSAGCGGGPAEPDEDSLAGTWTGTWQWSGQSGTGGCVLSHGGAFSMTLTQSGASFMGTPTASGINSVNTNTCAQTGSTEVTGSVSGSKTASTTWSLSLVLVGPNNPLTFSGTLTQDHDRLTASFTRDTGGSGTLTLTKQTGSSNATIASISVTPSSPSIAVGGTQQFTAAARSAAGSTVSTSFTWKSSNTNVATINSSGLVTAVAAGTSTITATSGTIEGNTTLTVTAPVVSWTNRADMPTARYATATAVVNGIVYVIGGANANANALNPHLAVVEAYDPATNTWTTKAPMPNARSFMASAVSGGVIYVFGGDNGIAPTSNANTIVPTTFVQAYDPATNTWTSKASMPVARERFAAAEVGGVIYVMGGLIPSGNFVESTNTVAAYTVSTNTWTTKANMPAASTFHSAAVVTGVIYAMGGFSPNSSSTRAYDPASNAWSAKANMASSIDQPVSVAANGLVYAVDGGASIQTYNPVTNAWTTRPGTTTGYADRELASLALVGTTMYSIGGRNSFGTLKTVQSRPLP